MISEHDRIFKNLLHQKELSLNQARQQADWFEIEALLSRSKEDLREIIRLSKVREKDDKALLVFEKWKPFIRGKKKSILVIDGSCGVPGDVGFLHLIYYETYKIIEGALLTAFLVGSEVGYFYIASDQPRALQVIQRALEECYANGLLGSHILGTDFSFHLHLHFGSAHYVSYSDEALVHSLAGEKQPSETLFGKPVLIHKVETIAALPTILRKGGEWFSSLGTPHSAGTKIFSLSGHVNKPCVIEESFGVSLRATLEHYAGGVRGGWSHLNFVFPSGINSPVLLKSFCNDLVLSYENVGAFHSFLGSGSLIVVNGSVNLMTVMLTAMQFFLKIPLSSCVFCIKGIPACAALLKEWKKRETNSTEETLLINQLTDLSMKIEQKCQCSYARQSLNPIKELLRYWRDSMIQGNLHMGSGEKKHSAH